MKTRILLVGMLILTVATVGCGLGSSVVEGVVEEAATQVSAELESTVEATPEPTAEAPEEPAAATTAPEAETEAPQATAPATEEPAAEGPTPEPSPTMLPTPVPLQSNIAFILDASGSMMNDLEGRTRLAVAKEALLGLSQEIPPESKISLWVYGHRVPQDDKEASCQDIEEVIPLGPINAGQFEGTVQALNALGYTPISRAIELAAASLPVAEGQQSTVVLVSDGEETCAGDPCAMAQALKERNIDLVINTIGFAVDENTRQQLQCIAEVTDGAYFEAQSGEELGDALSDASGELGTIHLVDEAGQIIDGVGLSVHSAESGEHVASGGSGMQVPPGVYNVRVDTTIPFEVQIVVQVGEITEIVVGGEGTVAFVDENGQPREDVAWTIDHADSDWSASGAGSKNLPPGEYVVHTRTEYSIELPVTIVAGETTTLTVPRPGTLQLVDGAGNPAEVGYSLMHEATGQRMAAAGNLAGQFEYDLQPGVYIATVKTDPRFEIRVTILSGQKTTINVDDQTTNNPG